MEEILNGTILIADPFLKIPISKDQLFLYAIMKLQAHSDFVLNRKENLQLGDLLTGLEGAISLYIMAAPVQMDSMHFLHQCPKLISGGVEITDGIFWGGNFEEVVSLLQKEVKATTDKVSLAIAAGVKASSKRN